MHQLRQLFRGKILVHHRRNAMIARFRLNNRDSPAPAGNNNLAGADERIERHVFVNADRLWRRHHPPPAASGVLDIFAARLFHQLFGGCFVIKSADRLGWVFKGRVVFIHDNLRKHCNNRRIVVSVGDKLGIYRLLEVVADVSLAHRRTLRKRHQWRISALVSFFKRKVNHPHLRAVPVAYDDIVPSQNQRNDRFRRISCMFELLLRRVAKRIPAECNYHSTHCFLPPFPGISLLGITAFKVTITIKRIKYPFPCLFFVFQGEFHGFFPGGTRPPGTAVSSIDLPAPPRNLSRGALYCFVYRCFIRARLISAGATACRKACTG
ncbi:MAG: hypothetical protein DELT_03068 [Desulfovibrio sp.]